MSKSPEEIILVIENLRSHRDRLIRQKKNISKSINWTNFNIGLETEKLEIELQNTQGKK